MIMMPQVRESLYSSCRKTHQVCLCNSCTNIPYYVLCRQGNTQGIHAKVGSAHKANVRPSTCQLIISLEHSEMQGIDLMPGRVP